jgi:hypothetical protein
VERFSVLQRDDAQIPALFCDELPESNAAVFLNLSMFESMHCLKAPFKSDVGTFVKNASLEVCGVLHLRDTGRTQTFSVAEPGA